MLSIMSRIRFSKISIAALLLAITAMASFYAFSWAVEKLLFADMCGNRLQTALSSPNGKLQAVIFERNCGATTGVSQQVSILEAGLGLPNEAGNIFRAEMYYGYDPDNPGNSNPEIEARWAGNDELIITTHNQRAKIFHVAQELKGVRIRHDVTPKPTSNNAMQPTANSVLSCARLSAH
jgi:hypothetical protein